MKMTQSQNLDRRRVQRIAVALEAWVHVPLRASLPCLIRDFGSTGARLEIEDVGALPTTFRVSIDTIAFEAHCKVRHKYGRNCVGVSFVNERGSAKLAALMSSLNPLNRTLTVLNQRQCAFGRRGRGVENGERY